MVADADKFERYFIHLKSISLLGQVYKKYISSPILFFCARKFGSRIVEVGSGTGSGVLGSYPKDVMGLEINPYAVEHCKSMGLDVKLIGDDGMFPVQNAVFDACILDNVLEHIALPSGTLNECYRITKENGGLIIVVPGMRGYASDDDHKKFYDAEGLRSLDDRWLLQSLFSIPFMFRNEKLSRLIKQYCLVAIYKKV